MMVIPTEFTFGRSTNDQVRFDPQIISGTAEGHPEIYSIFVSAKKGLFALRTCECTSTTDPLFHRP